MKEYRKIGKYHILDTVGQGGMGRIYKGFNPQTKKNVIIKQLLVSSKLILTKRFEREANIMFNLHHKNIVHVYNQYKENSSYCIVMEYVDGLSLAGLIKNKTRIISLPAILIFREICMGLKYAHNKGIIHRDIKPDNVLISKKGEVKLADFGIATALFQNKEELTETGVMMGTPAYMSPEQIMNTKCVDKRSDIYSMGVMFYEMITGKKPFTNEFTSCTFEKIKKGKYIKPQKIDPKIPLSFNKIIKKTMNCNIQKRCTDLTQLIDILSQYIDNEIKNQKKVNFYIKKYIFGNKVRTKKIKDKDDKKINEDKIIFLILKDFSRKNKCTVSIGRSQDNDIVLRGDMLISRNHAVFEKTGSNYYIKDLHSSNGTFINKKRIIGGKKVKITTGDCIVLGKTKLQVRG